MGSSAKKKKEKKADFQKVKLKVGKSRPKAQNQTNTDFKAKAIVLNQQIAASTPDLVAQFKHHVSLLGSRNEAQRKESLAWLTTAIVARRHATVLPTATVTLLDKLLPLLLDASVQVRNQLEKLLKVLPPHDLADHISKVLPYVRASLTHLSASIRSTGLDVLSYLLSQSATIAPELISSAGGWTKTLDCLATLLGWRNLNARESWSMAKAGFRGDAKVIARTMQVLEQLLSAGLKVEMQPQVDWAAINFPLWDCQYHCMPIRSNVYGYLNLFGPPPDEDEIMLDDQEERLRAFEDRFGVAFRLGLDGARREGGDIGRVAGSINKILKTAPVESG